MINKCLRWVRSPVNKCLGCVWQLKITHSPSIDSALLFTQNLNHRVSCPGHDKRRLTLIYLHQHGGWQDLPGPYSESRSTCAKLPRNCAPGCSPPQGGRASPPPSSAAAHGADGAGGGHDLLLHLERSHLRSPSPSLTREYVESE